MGNNVGNYGIVRWYDWVAAFLLADFILAFVKVMLFAPDMLTFIFAAISLYGSYKLWEQYYCPFRKRQEENLKRNG